MNRIDFLLPQELELKEKLLKVAWKYSGRMYCSKVLEDKLKGTTQRNNTEDKDKYKSKVETALADTNIDNNSQVIYTLHSEFENYYQIYDGQKGMEIIKSDDHYLDSIINKLNLMYGLRQSYSIEGFSWKSSNFSKDNTDEDFIIKCSSIRAGGESVNILLEINSAQYNSIMASIFPDISIQEQFHEHICERTDPSRYLHFIIKVAKLNV